MIKYLQSRILLNQVNEGMVSLETAKVIAKFSDYYNELGRLVMSQHDQQHGCAWYRVDDWAWTGNGVST